MVWAVDHVGPVLSTELLLPALRRSGNGRVITVSSKGLLAMPRLKVDTDDPAFERRRFSVTRAYYLAKRAQVIYTYWLADRLAGTSMTANCVRVTAVKIDLSRYPNLSAFRRRMYSLKSRMSITPKSVRPRTRTNEQESAKGRSPTDSIASTRSTSTCCEPVCVGSGSTSRLTPPAAAEAPILTAATSSPISLTSSCSRPTSVCSSPWSTRHITDLQ
jgi:NAD(P)-dependent dehydrogenase (short-subunit alcohol dehydrogenase family)